MALVQKLYTTLSQMSNVKSLPRTRSSRWFLVPSFAHLSSGETPMLMQDSLLGQRSPASVEVELLGRNVERHIIGTPTGECLLTTNWAGLDNGKLSCGDVQGIDVRGEAGEGLLGAIRSAQL